MSRTVRFYLDENVGAAVWRSLQRRGIDVRTTADAGLLGASDDEHLAYARTSGRVVVTRDDDFLAFHAEGRSHAGVAYASQRVPLGRLLDGLLLIHAVLDAEDMEGRVEFL